MGWGDYNGEKAGIRFDDVFLAALNIGNWIEGDQQFSAYRLV